LKWKEKVTERGKKYAQTRRPGKKKGKSIDRWRGQRWRTPLAGET